MSSSILAVARIGGYRPHVGEELEREARAFETTHWKFEVEVRIPCEDTLCTIDDEDRR